MILAQNSCGSTTTEKRTALFVWRSIATQNSYSFLLLPPYLPPYFLTLSFPLLKICSLYLFSWCAPFISFNPSLPNGNYLNSESNNVNRSKHWYLYSSKMLIDRSAADLIQNIAANLYVFSLKTRVALLVNLVNVIWMKYFVCLLIILRGNIYVDKWKKSIFQVLHFRVKYISLGNIFLE